MTGNVGHLSRLRADLDLIRQQDLQHKRLFDSTTVISTYLLDMIIMLTFGLACPLLGFSVALSVFQPPVVGK